MTQFEVMELEDKINEAVDNFYELNKKEMKQWLHHCMEKLWNSVRALPTGRHDVIVTERFPGFDVNDISQMIRLMILKRTSGIIKVLGITFSETTITVSLDVPMKIQNGSTTIYRGYLLVWDDDLEIAGTFLSCDAAMNKLKELQENSKFHSKKQPRIDFSTLRVWAFEKLFEEMNKEQQ
jgi:hypothetical protein